MKKENPPFQFNSLELALIADDVLTHYDEPHRHYHNRWHIYHMLGLIHMYAITGHDELLLILFTLFHDVVYNPASKKNEEDSVQFLLQYSKDKYKLFNALGIENSDLVTISEMIMKTKDPFIRGYDITEIARILDTSVLRSDVLDLIEYERGIFLEYQSTDIFTYLSSRISFLQQAVTANSYSGNILKLIKYIETKQYKIGIFFADAVQLGDCTEALLESDLKTIHEIENLELFDKLIVEVHSRNGIEAYGLPNEIRTVKELEEKPPVSSNPVIYYDVTNYDGLCIRRL